MLINRCILSIFLISTYTHAQTYDCQPTHKLSCDHRTCQYESEGFQSSEVYLWDSTTQMLTACMGESCFEGVAQRLGQTPLKIWAALRTTHPDRQHAAPIFDVLMDIDADGTFRVLMGNAKHNTMVYGQCQANPKP